VTISPGTLMGSTVGAQADHAGCTANSGDLIGPERVYQITVPAGQRLSATVTPVMAMAGGLQYDPGIYLVRGPANACPTMSRGDCLAVADDPMSLAASETVTYTNTSNAAETIFIVIDSFWDMANPQDGVDAVGNFTLSTSLSSLQPGDACANALPLTIGMATNASTNGFGNDVSDPDAVCLDSGSTGDRVFTALVPAGAQLQVALTVSGSGSAFAALYSTLATCTGGRGCSSVAFVAATQTANGIWNNRSTMPQTVYIVVESSAAMTTLTATLGAPTGNDVCASPVALVPNVSVSDTTVGAANDYVSPEDNTACFTNSIGPDKVYSLSVAPGHKASIVVVPTLDGGFNPGIHLVASALLCEGSPLICEAGANDAPANQAETLRYFNTSNQPRSLLAIVDSRGSQGRFGISYASSQPGPDETCTTANTVLVADGGLANQSLAGFGNDYGAGEDCFPVTGPDRAYRLRLEPGARYTGVFTPTAGSTLNLVVSAFSSAQRCDAASLRCGTTVNTGAAGAPETVSFVNEAMVARDFFVVAASATADAGVTPTFSIQGSTASTAVNDVCATATLLTGTSALTAQTTTGLSSDYFYSRLNCEPYEGPDAVYAIDVPPSRTLNVDVTATGAGAMTTRPVINLVAGPTAEFCQFPTQCLASNASITPSAITTYRNTSGASERVFIVVSTLAAAPMTYDLRVTLP
jgi:hypothetical protein